MPRPRFGQRQENEIYTQPVASPRSFAVASSQSTYNYKVVRQFAIMTIVWGIVGMLVGVILGR